MRDVAGRVRAPARAVLKLEGRAGKVKLAAAWPTTRWRLETLPRTSPMNPGYGSRLNCTACGSELRRVRRQSTDGAQRSVRRYACTSEACNWQGLLARMPARRRAPAARRWRRALRAVAAPLVVAVGLSAGLAMAAWYGLQQRPAAPVPGVELALGDHHDGVPLPPTHPLLLLHGQQATAASAATPAPLARSTGPASNGQLLSLRRGCVWGQTRAQPLRRHG